MEHVRNYGGVLWVPTNYVVTPILCEVDNFLNSALSYDYVVCDLIRTNLCNKQSN
jgi:hypothetical protein